MILDKDNRFTLVDNDGNLVIITELEIDNLLTIHSYIDAKGKVLNLDCEDLNADSLVDADILLSLTVEKIETKD